MNYIHCFTDGGFKKEPATCSYGIYIILDSEKESKQGLILYGLVEDHEKRTSQISEMYAIKVALETLLEYGFTKDRIVLYSDSRYCINTMQSWYWGWIKKGISDSKQNIELWHYIMDMVKQFRGLEFCWIRGHQKDDSDFFVVHNNLADRLNQVAIGRTSIEKVKDWYYHV